MKKQEIDLIEQLIQQRMELEWYKRNIPIGNGVENCRYIIANIKTELANIK